MKGAGSRCRNRALASSPKEQATETDVALFRACSTTTTQGAHRISKQVFALLSVFLSVVFGFGSVHYRFDHFPTICPEHQFLARAVSAVMVVHAFFGTAILIIVIRFSLCRRLRSPVHLFRCLLVLPSQYPHISLHSSLFSRPFQFLPNNSQFQKMIRLLFVFFERVLHIVVNQTLRGKQFSPSTTNLDTTNIVLVPLSHRVMAIDPFVSHFAVTTQLHNSTFTAHGNRKVMWAIFRLVRQSFQI